MEDEHFDGLYGPTGDGGGTTDLDGDGKVDQLIGGAVVGGGEA